VKINKQKIIDELSLVPFGGKGWMKSEETKCPVCNRGDKFGILFTENGGVTHCFYECSENLSIFKYLKAINRNDLLIYEQEISLNTQLKPLKKEEEKLEELPEKSLPRGYERIYFDKYLKDRNFKGYQYDQFEVGVTTHFLEKKLHNYLIFVIRQKGRVVAWLARSKYSKEWHKKNLERSKLDLEKLVLRYRNSEETAFDRILGGFDEITDNTHTVFAVEGIFDKTNLSNHLKTNESEEVKVIFTFGNSFSDHQIQLLRETKVKTVILMYDPGTVRQIKQYSMELSKYFEVLICDIQDEEVDPGNISKEYLGELLLNVKNFLYFYTTKITNTKIVK